MTKKLTFNCDICKEEINGEMSVYVFGDILLMPNLSSQQVQKESHFCKECTEDVKQGIEMIYRTKEGIKNNQDAENNSSESISKQADEGSADQRAE